MDEPDTPSYHSSGPPGLFSRNENSFFGRHFETQHFLNVGCFLMFFLLIYGCFKCIHRPMVQVSYRNSYGKVPKNEWVQVDPLGYKRE